ncbi:MAG: phosphate signaling complex protein PhoU [Candidatus Wallbacteria bacterium]|nr:phosphate signaling complex protein PhoU [Candidatus Wallbacteria bacterium]
MLSKKLEFLKSELIAYAGLVTSMIEQGMTGLMHKDRLLLREIIFKSEPIANFRETDLEEHCVHTIAQFEPKAKDLRTVLMILKITNDLERIGDHAVNIAESILYLVEMPPINSMVNIPKMAEMTVSMLRDSLRAFIEENSDLARSVCARDNEIDELRDRIYRELIDCMSADSSSIERALHLMRISRNLERVADLSTNFCEDTIFMVSGVVIKHHLDE